MSNNQHVSDILPDRPIGTQYEIALLYYLCSEYENQKEYEKIHNSDNIDIDTETLTYLTPNKGGTNEDPKIISAKVDLTEEPKLAEDPIDIEAYDNSKKFLTGYISNPGKSGAAIDYSITNHLGSGGQDAETLAYDDWGSRFLRGRFENWAMDDLFDDEVEDNKYNIVKSMRKIGEDKDEMKRLESSLLDEYADDDTVNGYVTVKFKIDDSGYRYPVEFNEINRMGIKKANNKLRVGRSTNKDSFGTGTSMIRDKEETVVGASDGAFAQYGKKQRDAFPDLNTDRGWEQRPLSEPVAKAISGFNNIEGEFGKTINSLYMLYLPYPKEKVNTNIFERFYKNVYSELKDIEKPDKYINAVSDIMTTKADYEDIFSDFEFKTDDEYTVKSEEYNLYSLIAEKEQTSVYNVFIEEMNTKIESITDISNNHIQIYNFLRRSNYFESLFSSFKDSGYSLMSENNITPKLLYGKYLEDTTQNEIDSDKTNTDSATTNDPRVKYTGSILKRDRLNSDMILREFVNKTESERRNSDDSYPSLWPVIQSIQLSVLDKLEFITTHNINSYEINISCVPQYDNRNDKLESYLKSNNALKSSEARSVFITGGLVGYLSGYQDQENISGKMTSKYPITSVNRRTVKEFTADVLNKREEYVDKENTNIGSHYTARLPEYMMDEDPENWSLTNAEIQWLYSLGIAYGKNDYRSKPDSKGDQQ